MAILLIIIGVFLLLIFGSLFFIMAVLNHAGKSASKNDNEPKSLSFNWKYISIPLVVLLLTIIMVLWFYGKLPIEVAYHFTGDGEPDIWTTRGMLLFWTLMPQVLLILLAVGVNMGIARIGASMTSESSSKNILTDVQLLMGNMVALPQLILSFAMLNIFRYNAFKTTGTPLWLIAIIIIFVGGVSMAFFFIRAFNAARKESKKDPHQDKS
jgi:uncharacterized membrane protein